MMHLHKPVFCQKYFIETVLRLASQYFFKLELTYPDSSLNFETSSLYSINYLTVHTSWQYSRLWDIIPLLYK